MLLALVYGLGAAEKEGVTPHASAVVAVVNGKPVTFGDVWQRLRLWAEHARSLPEERYQALLKKNLEDVREDLIETQLLIARAHEEGFEATERHINRVIELNIERLNQAGANLTSVEDYWAFIEETRGYSRKDWKKELRIQVYRNQLFRKFVWQPEYFSPTLVRSYYQEHKNDFQEGGYVTIRQIYIRRDIKGYRDVVKRIEAEIVQGETFKRVAERAVEQGLSTLPGRDGAGLCMYRVSDADDTDEQVVPDCDGNLKDLVDPLPERIAALGVGEVDGPLARPTGTYFVKVVKRSGGRIKSFAEVQRQIHNSLRTHYETQAERKFYDVLKKRADITRLSFPEEIVK